MKYRAVKIIYFIERDEKYATCDFMAIFDDFCQRAHKKRLQKTLAYT